MFCSLLGELFATPKQHWLQLIIYQSCPPTTGIGLLLPKCFEHIGQSTCAQKYN